MTHSFLENLMNPERDVFLKENGGLRNGFYPIFAHL